MGYYFLVNTPSLLLFLKIGHELGHIKISDSGIELSKKSEEDAADIEGIKIFGKPSFLFKMCKGREASSYGTGSLDEELAILEKAKRLANRCGCDVIDMISHGDPSARIIDIATERRIDVIILGSRGVSGIKRLFTGSISDKVSKNAACPVMIVR